MDVFRLNTPGPHVWILAYGLDLSNFLFEILFVRILLLCYVVVMGPFDFFAQVVVLRFQLETLDRFVINLSNL